MAKNRHQKIADLIKKQISQIIIEQIADPLVGFVTVTDVKISSDLKNAKIYVTVLGDDKQREDTLRGLRRASSFIRWRLGMQSHLRHTPEIDFFFDDTSSKAQNIEHLIQINVSKKR